MSLTCITQPFKHNRHLCDRITDNDHRLPLTTKFVITQRLSSDDNRAADQSHEDTYKAQHSKMTSLKNKREGLLKSLKSHSEIL
ncbi:hypothetical protein PAMA_000381 [Pampus argenteus]